LGTFFLFGFHFDSCQKKKIISLKLHR
jgi:hypothetical protein